MTTRMREIAVLGLARAQVSATGSSTEVDVSKYYVSPGTREMMAVISALPTGADADETLDSKLQESATTVDSDFTDISGASFTQLTQPTAAGALQAIYFSMASGKKYVREAHTLAGTTPTFDLSVMLFAVKRSA